MPAAGGTLLEAPPLRAGALLAVVGAAVLGAADEGNAADFVDGEFGLVQDPDWAEPGRSSSAFPMAPPAQSSHPVRAADLHQGLLGTDMQQDLSLPTPIIRNDQ